MIQATQIPKAPSKKENNVKTPAITIATEVIEKKNERINIKTKSNPTLAAKIFGPALINWVWNERYFKIFLDAIPIKLYFEKIVALKKKSSAKNNISNMLFEKPKAKRIITVNKALILVTRSLICLSEMGQI